MKIGFDARCLEEDKISGVGEYALNLLGGFLEIDSKNQYIIFSNSFKEKNSRHFKWLEKYPNVKLKRFSFPNKLMNFFFWYFNWPKIDKMIESVDIFFAPNINFLALDKDCPLIATFHDLSFERQPYYFPRKTRWWHKYFVNPRRIAKASKRIVAVSESTKLDLEEIYRLPSRNIDIVYHGVSNVFKMMDKNDPKFSQIQKKYNLPPKFILYLGNIEPRKNTPSLISAYNNFVSKYPARSEYKLVLAGNILPQQTNISKNENIFTCGYIEREDRTYVYSLASLFVYPSFFEGFGLPILESMACGTPVIASHNSSIPEVTGDASIQIDPNRPDQIFDALKNILSDEKLYERMRNSGLERAKYFSWKKCAEETLNIIQNAKIKSQNFGAHL